MDGHNATSEEMRWGEVEKHCDGLTIKRQIPDWQLGSTMGTTNIMVKR